MGVGILIGLEIIVYRSAEIKELRSIVLNLISSVVIYIVFEHIGMVIVIVRMPPLDNCRECVVVVNIGFDTCKIVSAGCKGCFR